MRGVDAARSGGFQDFCSAAKTELHVASVVIGERVAGDGMAFTVYGDSTFAAVADQDADGRSAAQLLHAHAEVMRFAPGHDGHGDYRL